jgi:tyrosine-protein kinase Etk/Wzc
VTWRDAETAARVANLLAERYAKMTVKSNQEEMRTTRGYIEERIRETREDLAAMERKIEDYRVGEKLYATSTDAGAGRTDLGLGLEELSAYLRDLNAARVSWEQLDTRIAALKPYQTPAALAAVEAERAGLKTRQAAVEKVIVEQMAKLDKLPAKEAGLLDLYRGRMSKERALISLQDRLLDTRVAEAAQLGAARIIDKAIAPPFPEGPLLLRNAAAAILAGLLLSVAFMLLVETRRAGMRSREDLGDGSDSMVGLVPYVAGGGAGDPDTERSGRRREFLRGLVHGRYGTAAHRRIAERHMEDLFLRLAEGEGPRICMLISLRGGEGKTFLIERLARVAQGAGRKVLLVDANLNQPGLHRLFGKPQSKGLMEMLSGAEAARDVVVPVDPSVDLICGGLKRPHPDAKWALDEVKEELAVFALASRYDLVLIDTMSFRSDPSAARLLSLTSVPVCVFDATTSEKADLDDVRAQIGKKAQGLRFVLNKVMYGRDYGFVSGAEAAAADTTAEPGTPVAADGSRKGGGGTRTEGEKRGPIRHHTSLPIICCAKEDAPGAEHELRAISPDSLSCWGEERHEPGTRLHIGFPWLSPGVSVKGRVGATTAIATPRGRIRHLHEVNLAKESEVVLGTLMETVRRIEEYRRDQAKRCGRNLTAGEAAKEWAALSKMTGEAGSPSVS